MTRRWILAMCMLALTAGCGVPAQDQAQRARDEAVPFALLDAAAPPIVPAPSGPSSEPVDLCFVRDGRLVIVSQEVGAPADLRAALDALASPPADAGPLLRTTLTEPSVVREVRLLGGIARVDLLPEVSALPADDQLLAVAQIVCTLTGRPGVGQVSFTLQGARLAVPKDDGSLISSPVARDDYAGLMT